MSTDPGTTRKVTTATYLKMKAEHTPITMLTAYDYPTAYYLDQAGIDGILVGDSVAMVELGYETTLYATMDMMVHHTRAVRRGVSRAMVVADMPFLSYQVSTEDAVRNAGRLMQEAGADAVKIEGGEEMRSAISAVIRAGIPVMGHLGLTPQSIHQLGGYGLQAATEQSARKLLSDAMLLEDLGCFSVVLEKIPMELAAVVTQQLRIPTIGIGAGSECDGQILVTHDILGLFDKFRPKFVKRYMELGRQMQLAFAEYVSDVREKRFPTSENSYAMDPAVAERLRGEVHRLRGEVR